MGLALLDEKLNGADPIEDIRSRAAEIHPLGDLILVLCMKPDERSKGGIFIPQMARERPAEGEVLAIGPGQLLPDGARAASCVKPGDVVLFGQSLGTQVQGFDDVYLVREAALLATKKVDG